MLLLAALWLLPLRHWTLRLRGFNATPPLKQNESPDPATKRRLVSRALWAVDVASRRGLVAGTCLSRSLTLRDLLARRGIDTALRIGVSKELQRLSAHAWVEYEGEPLNDAPDVRTRFAPLERAGS